MGPMRVLADTRIAPQSGFPMCGHRDFEIGTYVCEGAITHADTTGAEGLLRMSDIQVMTAGSGLVHIESHPGQDPTRVYQMWFHSEETGLAPDYTDLRPLPDPSELIIYTSGAPGISSLIRIRQNATVSGKDLKRGGSIPTQLAPECRYYVLAVDGPIAVNDAGIPARGGAEVSGETSHRVAAQDTPSRVLRIDVAETYEAPQPDLHALLSPQRAYIR